MTGPRTRQEFATVLREARHRSGLSLRALAKQVGLSASTVQGWFEGKHLPTLALQEEFLALVRTLELTAELSEDEWLLVLGRLRGLGQVGANPYLGLRSFTPEDADNYFGRGALLDELVAAVLAAEAAPYPGLVAVVGVSGSGKSSLLQAGLIGRECGGGRLKHFTPVLVPVLEVASWQAPDDGPVLLVVDHVESLRSEEPEVADAALNALASQPEHVVCVFGLAAHAFDLVASDGRLRRALAAPVLLGALVEDEFRQIIAEPARLSGRPVDDALVALVLRSLWRYGAPPASVLPMLSNTMHQAWANAKGPTVTVQDYLAIGGIWGSLERLAEGLYEAATPEGQRHIRRLFLDLVQISSDGIERRPVDVAALPDEAIPLAEDYLNARLLTLEGNELSVGHSALLSRWQRLGAWVDEEREQLMFRRRIGKAAEVWAESNRDPKALIPVEALVFDQFTRNTDIALTPLETDFFEASVARAEEESERQRQEIGRLRRRNVITTVLGIIAVVGLLLTGVMVRRAESFQVAAEEARAQAQSRQLALIAEEMRPTDRNVAAQLSLAARRTSDTLEARAAVLKSAGVGAPRRVLGEPGTVRLASSPAGDLLVRVSADGTIEGWRDGNFDELAFETQVTDGQLFGVGRGEEGGRDLVAVAGQGTASIWDVTEEPELIAELGADTVAYSAAIGGGRAYLGMLDGTIRRFDLGSGTELEPLDTGTDAPVESLSVRPDGTALAAAGRSQLLIWQRDDPAPQRIEVADRVTRTGFAPDGNTLAVGGLGGTVQLYEVPASGPAIRTMEQRFTESTVHSLTYDGERIFVGVWDGRVGALSRQGALLGSFSEASTVTGLTLLGPQLVTGTMDGALRIWPERYAGLLVEGSANSAPSTLTGEHIIKYFDGHAAIFDLDGRPSAQLQFTGEAGTGLGPGIVSDHVVSLPTESGRLATWDLPLRAAGNPVYSDITEGHAYQLFSGPDGWAAYAELNKEYVTVIRRNGLQWNVVAEVPTWSTLATGWHPARPWLAAMSVDSTRLTIHDFSGGEPRMLGEVAVPMHGASIRLAWAPDGRGAYIGTDGGLVIRVDISDDGIPTLAEESVEVSAGVSSIAVSHDGESVAAGLLDGRIHIWRLNEDGFETAAALRPGGAAVEYLHLHEDEVVFITDEDGIHSWPLGLAAATEELCAAIGEPLTSGEWERTAPDVTPVDGCAN